MRASADGPAAEAPHRRDAAVGVGRAEEIGAEERHKQRSSPIDDCDERSLSAVDVHEAVPASTRDRPVCEEKHCARIGETGREAAYKEHVAAKTVSDERLDLTLDEDAVGLVALVRPAA